MVINTSLHPTNGATDGQPLFQVASDHVRYSQDLIESKYKYTSQSVDRTSTPYVVKENTTLYEFRIQRKLPKVGVMLVGWGGNNGSTLTASILANRANLEWNTKEGLKKANYFGSVTQASTFKLGLDAQTGDDVYVPFSSMLPMVNPNEIVLGGWDISSANLGEAMRRAQVLDWDLQQQLYKQMSAMQPLPSIYYPDYIAANQSDRADNLIPGTNKQEHLNHIRRDIRQFKEQNDVDTVIVVWTANTERYSDIIEGVNDSAANLLSSVSTSHSEIAPSTIFALASILEGAPFINGSPQNTFVPGVIDLAQQKGVFIGGDDFKSGQTKLKSVLVDFLVNAGLKPLAITSYNHLGNNDGKNLSAPQQFRSKEISKSNVVDDMVEANQILYPPGEKPDHIVVIKYCPSVGDSKRAMDEYVSEIFMGGRNVISIYNVCEDSLLASPLILDLVILTELFTRIKYRTDSSGQFHHFHPVLSVLSYMLKAPVVPPGTRVVNALSKQRSAVENILRACLGLSPQHDMMLEAKCF